MSQILKIILVFISILALGLAAFTGNKKNAGQESILPEAYEQYYQTEGPLEDMYTRKGSYAVASLTAPSDHSAIKNIRIFYPAELSESEKRYPMILVVNGSNTPAAVYQPYFERLASWGFIVVGNDDPQTGSGETASLTLDLVFVGISCLVKVLGAKSSLLLLATRPNCLSTLIVLFTWSISLYLSPMISLRLSPIKTLNSSIR